MEDTDGSHSPKWVQLAMCPRARLPSKEKYEILVEYREQEITKGFEQVGSICKWAARKFHLKKEPSYRTIKRILYDEELLIDHLEQCNAEQKKLVNVSCDELEMHMREWVLDMWNKRVFLCDAIIQERARRVQCPLIQSLPVREQALIHFGNFWLDSCKKSSSVTRNTAKARTRTTSRQKRTSLSCGISPQCMAQMTYLTPTRWASSTPPRLQQLLYPPRCRGGRK